MWKRPKQQEKQSGITDPQLAYARLIAERDKSPVREKPLLQTPPQALHTDFCYDEESHS
jgi:hypothetical protein